MYKDLNNPGSSRETEIREIGNNLTQTEINIQKLLALTEELECALEPILAPNEPCEACSVKDQSFSASPLGIRIENINKDLNYRAEYLINIINRISL